MLWHTWDCLWGVIPKNVGMPNAYDLVSKVSFTANVVNLDNYEGAQSIIDLNFKATKSLKPMSSSSGEILENSYSPSYIDVVEETPPPHHT